MAILQISVVPLGTASSSLSTHLAQIPRLLERSGLPYQVGPMGSAVEGPAEDLLRLATELHEAGFGGGCQRVLTQLSLDDRRDRTATIEGKVARLLAAAQEASP